jgi:UDP-N-acetylmuramyl pentapeptide phosphotransferase/UDP-N-acetylglucosamine-1-phosphate transferase
MIATIFVGVVMAFALSAWLTRRFSNPDSIVYILDHPNERSLHDRPTPRGGGIAILVAIMACGAALAVSSFDRRLLAVASGMLVVAIVALLDDRYSVPPLYRLMAQTAAALIILYGGFFMEEFGIPGAAWHWPYAVGMGLSALFIVWMVNLYNFMDGMDGFAGGMAISGFGTFAILGWMADHELFASVGLIVASASAGFLVFNFPPARIFMGDIGSSTLGLLAAALSLWGVKDGVFPFWIAILVFSPFIMDATVTLLRRLLRREKIWQAHKTHYYQKLVQAGWGHRKTALTEYAIMIGCGVTALSSQHATVILQMILLAGWVLFYVIFFPWVSWYSARRCHGPL